MEDAKAAPAMAGATHLLAGKPVKATRWAKDGDHPKVVRYPIEKRDYKGLLIAGEKEKFGLRFGEWILEDVEGRLWVEPSQVLPAQYEPIGGGGATLAQWVIGALVTAALMVFMAPDPGSGLILAVTHLMYYPALLGQWNGLSNGVFDLDTDTMKVSAHTNTYSPNQDTDDFWNDASNEVSGTNYTTGGATLASVTLTRSTTTVTFDAADVVWTQSGAGFSNARKFVVYRSTGTGSTSRLLSVVTADGDVGNVTGDLTLAWHTSGILTWSTT